MHFAIIFNEVRICLKFHWFNFNVANICRYNLEKQKLFGVLNFFFKMEKQSCLKTVVVCTETLEN